MSEARSAETRRIVAALDDELDAVGFADGQENGLQVEGRPGIRRLASAVSVSQESLQAALDWDADGLLTHHGLLWKKEPLHVRGVRRARLKLLLENDLNLLTYHLPLDAHPVHGNNTALAELAGCTEGVPAFPMDGRPIGRVGTLEDPASFADWVVDFEAALRDGCPVDTGPFQVWPFGPDRIRRIGFLSGAAPYQVHDAVEAGCDVFVTGEPAEAVHHVAKEAGIHFIAGGHYLTERHGVQRLGAWLTQHFDVEHRFFDVETRV